MPAARLAQADAMDVDSGGRRGWPAAGWPDVLLKLLCSMLTILPT